MAPNILQYQIDFLWFIMKGNGHFSCSYVQALFWFFHCWIFIAIRDKVQQTVNLCAFPMHDVTYQLSLLWQYFIQIPVK